jgi:N-acetyl-anhydromuramyl-L-alanine amidase AmpD
MIVKDHVWTATTPGARRRPGQPRLIAWHWTGGKTSAGCVATLKKSGLSVHYTIDDDGTIREHADPLRVVTQHVKRVPMKGGALSINNASIGIEIAHKGFAPSFAGARWQREEYESTVHGVKRRLLRFTPAQT